MIRAFAIVAVGLLMASCATRPRTYSPPDPSKVLAAQRTYNQTVADAHRLANEARSHTIDAHNQAMQVTVTAANAVGSLGELRTQVPEEYRGAVDSVTRQVQSLIDSEDIMIKELELVQNTQAELEKKFVKAETDKKNVENEGQAYFQNAQRLADDASKENAGRVKAEQKLSWYRWHFWLSWIVAGAGVLLCIVLAILKFTGRLAIAGAKL